MKFDFAKLTPKERYKITSRTIIPRPIAWIATQDRNGTINLAPFSYFIPLSSEPPMLLVSVGHKKDGTPKDTLANLRETKRCTISMVDRAHLEPMHATSKPLPRGKSEAQEFQIPLISIFADYPPMVEGVPAAIGCSLHQEINLGGRTIPLILSMDHCYIDDRYIKDGQIELDLIARVGARYATLGEPIDPSPIP
ncbi:MAG: flavin reductase [Nitratiruptor sp.]|nr:flavin reductase [Nitratiruptor sp.]NPA83496.1 flavin reductase family protein [Campylobacterota bacterium]